MPTAKLLISKLVVDARTRKLLGAQAVGPGAGDKRMDLAAMAITAGMTVDQLSKVDLCYAPPYSPALDNIITAANMARNKQYDNGGAKEACKAIFQILGLRHPLVERYFRAFSSALHA